MKKFIKIISISVFLFFSSCKKYSEVRVINNSDKPVDSIIASFGGVERLLLCKEKLLPKSK